MAAPIDELRRARVLLGHAIQELRGIDAGRWTDVAINGSRFGDADRHIIEADAALYRASQGLGITPELRVSDTMSDGLRPDGGPTWWQRARAIDHVNRLHASRAAAAAAIASAGGDADPEDLALRPTGEERKSAGGSALKAAGKWRVIVAVLSLAVVVGVCGLLALGSIALRALGISG